jgi:hypothetical protein
MILVRHLLRVPLKAFDLVFGEQLLERFKIFANVSGFVTQRREERCMQLLASFEKLLRAFQGRVVAPLQRGADCDVRIE